MKKFLLLSTMFCGMYLHCSEEIFNDNYGEPSDEEIQRVEDNCIRDNQKEKYMGKSEKEMEEKKSYVEQINTSNEKIESIEFIIEGKDMIVKNEEENEKLRIWAHVYKMQCIFMFCIIWVGRITLDFYDELFASLNSYTNSIISYLKNLLHVN